MKIYLPRWARKAAAHTIFGAALSKQLKLNKPQQLQAVSIITKLQAPSMWIDLGRQDRKFLANRIRPFLRGCTDEAAKAFRPFYRIFLSPRLWCIYQFRTRGIALLLAALTKGNK